MSDNPTLSEYIDHVHDTLKYWLDLHTNPKVWAEAWIIDEDPQYTLKHCPIIENDYFKFDLRTNLARHVAREQRELFVTCRKCGIIFERGYEDEEDECYEGNHRHSFKQSTIKELAQWLDDLGDFNASDDAIMQCLIKDGFKVYHEALKDTIAPVVKEIKDCLKQFNGKPERILQAVTWANHICHVNGDVVKDYGDRYDLDYKFVSRVSQEGLVSVFGQEAIDEYLA